MIKQNLHTHTLFCDGKDTPKQMLQTAIDKGFTILGFSSHAYTPYDPYASMSRETTKEYIQAINKLKESAPDSIRVYLGTEEDSTCPINPDDYDYVIGSIRMVEKDGQFYSIDYSEEEFARIVREVWNGDIQAYAKDYYSQLEEQAKNDRFEIVGHIDLIAKYNEDEKFFSFDDPIILEASKKAVDALAKAGKIFEMNTGAISRGYRTTPYPSPQILKQIKEADGKLMINTDCHARDNLDLGMNQCLELAKAAGFDELYAFDGKQFVPRPIDEFVG